MCIDSRLLRLLPGKVQDVLLEVNVSGEHSKSGLAPADVARMLIACEPCDHVRVRGLMTMAPQGDLAAGACPASKSLRACATRCDEAWSLVALHYSMSFLWA